MSNPKHDFDKAMATPSGAARLELDILATQPDKARDVDLEASNAVRELQLTSNQLFRAASELQRTNRFQSMILDNINQGVVVVDEYSQIVAWNEVFLDLYQVTRKSIRTGMHVREFAEIFAVSDSASSDFNPPSCNGRLGDLRSGKYFDRLDNGKTIEIRVATRETGGLIATYADITPHIETQLRIENQRELLGLQVEELKELGKSLEEARQQAIFSDRQKSRFLAMISHDIRTPMSAVISTLELLASPADMAEAERLRQVALKSSRQMLYLLADVMEVSRSDGWNFSIETEQVAIADLLEAIADAWRPLAAKNGLSLQLAIDPALPARIETDSKRLRQVIDNLLSNAVKFTAKGELGINACLVHRDENPFLRITVTDTGRGISPSERHRLFQEFERISGEGEANAEGTGLGLSICKRVIENMGGTMGLDPEITVGSAFWLEVPSTEAGDDNPDASIRDAEARVTTATGAVPRVLLVDDIETNRIIISALLDKLGCAVTCASDGREGLAKIDQASFDAILLDSWMPEMAGGDVARAVRGMEGAMAAVPIIGVSASTDKQEIAALIDAGMDHVLPKPVGLAVLREQLERLLR